MYRRHVGDVYHYALAVLQNERDAEDVTQTTFLNAYRAFGSGERPEKPKNWLIAIAHNVCRQRFRTAARRPMEVPLLEETVAEAIDDADRPSAQDIRRALSHLSFNQRSALVMRELEGRSYEEIATILQLSRSAVETLLFRARRALREQLETGLTCREAEAALSRRADAQLGWNERRALRAHLRECPECAAIARRQRAQRAALRDLAGVPVPASLAALFGGGTATGGALVAKTAAVAAVAITVGAGTFTVVEHTIRDERFGAPVAAAGVAGERTAASRPATPRFPGTLGTPRPSRAPLLTRPARQARHERPRGRARPQGARVVVAARHEHRSIPAGKLEPRATRHKPVVHRSAAPQGRARAVHEPRGQQRGRAVHKPPGKQLGQAGGDEPPGKSQGHRKNGHS
jgi:RNA polymerase sigma factor (sigma-70 family)